MPVGTLQQFRNDGSAQMAAGATHTDFHVNLQYFSNEQIRWDNRAKQARGATCVFPTLALVLKIGQRVGVGLIAGEDPNRKPLQDLHVVTASIFRWQQAEKKGVP